MVARQQNATAIYHLLPGCGYGSNILLQVYYLCIASYLSCILVQIQLTLLVRFITTYSNNAVSLTFKISYHKK